MLGSMRVPASRLAGVVGTFVLMMAATLPYPLLDAFVVERFVVGGFVASLYVSVNLMAYVVVAPLAGRWVDGAGRPEVGLALGMVGQGVSLGVQPWVGSIGALLSVRFLEGAFTMVALTALHASVLGGGGGGRGVGAGVIGLGLAFGVAAGSALGGALGEVALWVPFVVGAGVLGSGALVALAWRPGAVGARSRGGLGVWTLLREVPGLWVPVGFSFADRLTVGFLVAALPLTLPLVQGFSPLWVGLSMTAFLVSFGLGQVPAGWVSERWGRWGLILVGSLAYGVLVGVIPFVEGWLLWVVLSFGGFAGAVMFAPSLALTGDLVPALPGRGVALFHQAGSLGFALGPLGAGALLGLLGARGAFVVAGLVEVLAAFALLALAVSGFAQGWAESGRPGPLR